jgi:hypothetical protein
MPTATEQIEVDAATASELRRRAAERGVSVADLVAELVPLVSNEDSLAELQRQWDLIERGEIATVPQAEVERWLRTWGTPDFRPWPKR